MGVCLRIQDQGVYFTGDTLDLSEDFAAAGKVSYISPGGDDLASVVSCSVLSEDVPHLGSKCILSDDDGVFWIGRLALPSWNLKTGDIEFGIQGNAHHLTDQRFPDSFIVPFGDTIDAAAALAISQRCPEITGGVLVGPSGIQLDADSEDFRGQTVLDVLNFLSSLTYYLTTPVMYHVMHTPTAGFEWTAISALEFKTMPTTASYIVDVDQVLLHPQGEVTIKQDIESVVNRVTVMWGKDQQVIAPSVGVPLDYDNVVIIRDKHVNGSRDTFALGGAQQLADGLLTRFNQLRGTGDSVTIPCDIAVCDPTTNLTVNPWRIRAGKVIRLRNMPDLGSYSSATPLYLDRLIVRSEHDFATGLTTLQLGELVNVGSVVRVLSSGWERRSAIPFQQGTVSMPFAQNDKLPVRGDVMPSVWSGASAPAVPMMDADNTTPYDHKVQPGLLGEVVVNFVISGGASPPATTLGRGSIGVPECRLDTWKVVATDTNGLVVDTAAVRVYKNTTALTPDVALTAANSATGTLTGTDAERSFNGTTDNLMFDLQTAPATAIVISVTLRGVRL